MTPTNEAHAPLLAVALAGRCPRCGRGKLFERYLKPAPSCSSCGLDFRFIDSGDGPAVFVILIVGFVVVIGALITEVKAAPPYWVHALLWLPTTSILALGLLRPAKALMIALQYRHRAREGRLVGTTAPRPPPEAE